MPSLHFIQADCSLKTVMADGEGTLMSAAIANNVAGLEAECGGCCICGTCHVYVDEAFIDMLPPVEAAEAEMLELTEAPREPGSRLACQLPLSQIPDGLVVTIPSLA
jgi:2Fe-2S ferredoxin